MLGKRLTGMLLVVALLFASACNLIQNQTAEPSSDSIGLANPASVYCQGLGYSEENREGEGGQYGVCILPDGKECDSWDFLAGRCGQEYTYCEKQGYKIVETADSNIGTCQFPDGTQCLEIEYFQGTCGPK
jgi:putative hemolysin